jgi:ectoine hydroxylase
VQLSRDQIEAFDANGFLLLPELLAAEEVQVLRNELQRLCELERDEVVRERTGTPRMVFRTHDARSPTASAAYQALARLPRVLGPARQVLRDDALYVHHSKNNVKMPIDGTAYQWHQDYGYWIHDGIVRPDMVTMMVMLDGATELGGCLYFLPQSHRLGRVEPEWDERTSSYGTWIVPRQSMLDAMQRCPDPVAVTGPPGTGALFHCNLMHASGHNLSRHSRWHAYTAFNTVANRARPVAKTRPEWVRGTDFTPLAEVEDDAILACRDAGRTD